MSSRLHAGEAVRVVLLNLRLLGGASEGLVGDRECDSCAADKQQWWGWCCAACLVVRRGRPAGPASAGDKLKRKPGKPPKPCLPHARTDATS